MCKVNLTSSICAQPCSPRQPALNVLESRVNPYLSQCYHATLFIPVHQTLLQATKKGYFAMWTNLTVGLMKHLSPSMGTAKGHMNQTMNNFQSTRTPDPTPLENSPLEKLDTCPNKFFIKIINPQQRITTSPKIRFPVTPNKGNKYLFFLYKCDSNSTLVWTIMARMDKKSIRVFQYLYMHLTTRVLKHNYIRLEN